VIDIAYVAPGFVSDKMPLSVVSELPLDFSGSCQGTMAYWNLAKPGGLLDKKEFAPNGVRLLFTIVLPPYQIITRKPFTNLKEIEGMKIRASGSAKELVIKKLKAIPVLMPTPDVYESPRAARSTASCSRSTAWRRTRSTSSRRPERSARTGTFVANWVISEKRFQSLPPAVQQDLTAMGEQLTRACTQVEKDEAGDIEKVKAAGVKLTPLSPADHATAAAIMHDVAKDWADTLDKRGKSGTEVLNAFKAGLK
jgi:TRAP-type C4-dicarboxylate transport system substrate-binding protein